ncbi:MAG: hypothetical protein AUI14_24815 [Actinobacteria bacterium 13_2_20CM_2_71_6]|nr:MAG: hypothetical protein AUI14_24815 [Actinobacteria bacterium 13_2_20CM_2_71_6]
MTSATTVATVGELRTVVRVGDPAPGPLDDLDAGAGPGRGQRPGDGRYERIGCAAVDDSGTVAFSADLAGSGAIVLASGGVPSVVVRAGEPAPGGGRYRSFAEIDLADGGALLFRAGLDGCPAREGVFLRTPAGTRAVVRAGDPIPGGDGRYASFAQLTLASPGGPDPLAPGKAEPLALAGKAGPLALAYVARLDDRRTCLVQHPAHRGPMVSLMSGSELPDGAVAGFVISRLGLALCCVADVQRRTGPSRRALIVNESTVSSGDWLREGGDLPGLGRISRLLVPPAVNAQLGILAVRAGRRGALCTRPPAFADPVVLARTGDRLPGLPGERITRFGPPVASTSTGLQAPFGVASAVRLTGGRTGLWVGVFGSQLPMTGRAIAPLLTGEPTDDRPALAVRAFTPVQLGNDGTLLLRATFDSGADGLVVLDSLFDWYAG